MKPVKGAEVIRLEDKTEKQVLRTNAVGGNSKRKSACEVKFKEVSLDDTEQVQIIACSLVRPECFELASIRQPLGITVSAGRERIGQILPAQQDPIAPDAIRLE